MGAHIAPMEVFMDDKTNNQILDEVHKGLVMGMESISVITSKVGDRNFRDDLNYQYDEYGKVLDRINKKFEETGKTPTDTTPAEKMMGWTSIQMSTISDKSNNKISEILIRGNTMGIIKGRELLNQYPNAEQETKDILNEFIKLQEDNIEKLKTYL